MFDKDTTFLKNLKAGDKVALEHYTYGKNEYYLEIVEKVTATQISLVGQTARWDRATGRQKGLRERFRSPPEIVELTKEVAASMRRRRNLSQVKAVKWDEVPEEVVAAVADIIRTHKLGLEV